MKDCDFCRNAYTDEELSHDNDLSYLTIGKCDTTKNIRAYLRSGDKKHTVLMVEEGHDLIWIYHPNFCPNCGRELTENKINKRRTQG